MVNQLLHETRHFAQTPNGRITDRTICQGGHGSPSGNRVADEKHKTCREGSFYVILRDKRIANVRVSGKSNICGPEGIYPNGESGASRVRDLRSDETPETWVSPRVFIWKRRQPSPLLTCSSLSPFSMTILANEHGSSSSSVASSVAPSSSRTSLNIDMPNPPSTPRHIRFAPLLDPRRAVLVTDDGHELPVKDDTHFPAATSLAVLRDKSQTRPTTCSDALEQSTPGSPSSSASFSSPTELQTSSSSSPYSPRPQSRSFTVDILKPFKRPPSPSRQKSRKSKSLSFSTEEILTLGTINLFRSSTLSTDQDSFKENNKPSSTSSHRNSLVGGGASRRISSNPQTEKEALGNNLPLTRLSGAQEGSDRKKRRSSIAAFFSAAPGVSSLVEKTKNQRAKRNSSSTASLVSGTSSPSSGSTITATRTPVLPPPQRTPRHKGARMLNGRIYGAKPVNRISENPFANARDDEPEFVEWGYGGMGSVKGARSAGVVGNNAGGTVNWERLLGGSTVSGQGSHSGWMVPGGGRGGAGSRRRQEKEEPRERRTDEVGEDGEEDDGSGLAWIRKRRKLREEKEKGMKENEHAREKAPGSESIPTPPVATIKSSVHDRDLPPGKAGPNGVDEHHHASSTQTTGTLNVNGHHEHVMKAVSVPMPPKLPSHHRRTSSKAGVLEDEEAQKGAMVATTVHDVEKLDDGSQQESVARPADSESSSSSSESSEAGSDSDGEDTSEEDQQENEKRRTAMCAGVEKVTASFRHRGE